MKRASSKGYVLSMEAVLAFLTAALFVYLIALSRPTPSPYNSLAAYAHLNDMLEVSYRAGDFENLAKWAGGDELAGEKAKANFETMAKELGFCLTLEVEDKNRRMQINCPGNLPKVSTTRTLVINDEFVELRATLN